MFILEDPYVSRALRDAALRSGRPILATDRAAAELPADALTGDQDFAQAFRNTPDPRLYTNSENALGWILEHLADTQLPRQIESMKDKVLFRELLREEDPDYRFRGVELGALEDFDPACLGGGPFVAKPAVGFFSLGVEIVETPDRWPAAARRLQASASRFRDLYPGHVLDLDRFVLEQVIEGDEFAVDAYYDADGQVTILDVLEHPFASGSDVSDRVYRASSEVIERTVPDFEEHLTRFGQNAGLRGVPIHVEYRIAADGKVRPIEANPMRFGGFCAADIATHAWGFCPYAAFLEGRRPDWERLCDERRGVTTALVVADLPPDLDRARIASIDYDGFVGRFTNPLELRKIDDPRQPVFAFLFVQVCDNELDQLDEILHADLTDYVQLR